MSTKKEIFDIVLLFKVEGISVMFRKKIEMPNEAKIATDAIGHTLPDTRAMRFVRFVADILITVIIAWTLFELVFMGDVQRDLARMSDRIVELEKNQQGTAALIKRIEALEKAR